MQECALAILRKGNDMIRVTNVSKVIKGQQILKDINLTLDKGKCYGFVGYNGSGKTMLLRAICGYMQVDCGEIEIDGQKIGKETEFIRDAGVLIGEMEFLNRYSGYENLEILAEIRNIIDRETILSTLKRVGLYSDRDKKVKKYSLGMKQRLRIAQALMEDPSILVLDEPFNALDKEGTREMQLIIQEAKAEGKTILLTSHDERNIEKLCDETYEMENGCIIKKEVLNK